MSVASPMKCEALVLFDVNVCYTYTQHVRLHPLEAKKPDLTLFTIETQPSFFLPSNTFLNRTHLSVFGVPPSRSARPQIHGNRGQ